MNATNILIATNVLVYLAYMTGKADIKSMCDKGLIPHIKQSFTHINLTHLLTNMYTMYAFRVLEKTYGTKFFMTLIFYIVCLNAVLSTIANKTMDLTCSIGFSGILFGVLIWQFFKTKKITGINLITALAFIVQPSFQNPKASLIGHFLGGLTGFLLAFIM